MKMTNLEMVNAINGVEFLMSDTDTPMFSVRVAHLINRNHKSLLELYPVYNEDRSKILEKKISEEKKEKELKELLETEIDVIIQKISIEDLDDMKLTVRQMQVLEFMVADGETDNVTS